MRALLAVAVALLLSACAENSFAKFYEPATVPPPPALQRLPYSGEPTLMASFDGLEKDINKLYEEGYGVVGTSDFVGPAGKKEDALAQAKAVGAAIVLLRSKYQSTKSGAMPLTLPTSQTTYSSGTFNSFGGSGQRPVSGMYSGSSTTYGTGTTYIPYSVDRYDQTAVFLAPIERKGAGLLLRNLTPAERQDLGTNKGVAVDTVRKGSPAYAIDIVPGDVILSINGQSVLDQPSAGALLLGARGSTVTLAMVRKGEPTTKEMSIPAGDW